MKRCANCRGTELAAVETEDTVKVGDDTFVVTIPATKCFGCGSVYIDGKVGERVDLSVGAALAGLGACNADALRFMRGALGMRAVDLALLLGVRVETISRWETGKVPVGCCVLSTLASLISDRLAGRTTTQDRLRAMQDPPRPKRRVRIHLTLPRAA